VIGAPASAGVAVAGVAGRILVIAHTEYDEEIRIISARPGSPASAGVAVAGVERPATPTERDFYEEGTTESQ